MIALFLLPLFFFFLTNFCGHDFSKMAQPIFMKLSELIDYEGRLVRGFSPTRIKILISNL